MSARAADPAIVTSPPPARRFDLARGASLAFALQVAGAILGFGFQVVLARLLGPGDLGIFALALTVTTSVSILGRLGMDNAILRFAAETSERAEGGRQRDLYRKAMLVGGVGSIGAALLVAALAGPFSAVTTADGRLHLTLLAMAASIPILSLVLLQGEFLKGLGRTRDSVLVQSVAANAVGLPLLLLLAGYGGLLGAVAAYFLGLVAALALGAYLVHRRLPAPASPASRFELRTLLATSLPLLWVGLLAPVLNRADIFLLGFHADEATVGAYAAAARTAALTSFVLVAVSTVAAPRFAALHARGDREGLDRLARSSTLLVTALAVPVLALFVPAPGRVLSLFGPGFVPASPALAILAAGQFVNVATGLVAYLLMMTGHEKSLRTIVVVSAVTNLGLNVALVPAYGMLGAAIASATGTALVNLLGMVVVWRRLGIVTAPIPRWSRR